MTFAAVEPHGSPKWWSFVGVYISIYLEFITKDSEHQKKQSSIHGFHPGFDNIFMVSDWILYLRPRDSRVNYDGNMVITWNDFPKTYLI